MNDRGVVVVVGSPSAVLGAGGAYEAVGLGVRVATELVRRGEQVELVGRVGADAAGDQSVLSLALRGIGHVALLRDPSLRTPISGGDRGAPVDAGDVQLALRYLADYSSVLLIDPLDDTVVRQASEDAASVGAALIVVANGPSLDAEAATLPAIGTDTPPPLFVPRPEVEEAEFVALLAGLAAGERGARTEA